MSFRATSQSQWGFSSNLIRFHLPVTSLVKGKRIVHLWPHPRFIKWECCCWRGKTEDGKKLSPPYTPLSLTFLLLLPISSCLVILNFSQWDDRNTLQLLGLGLFPARLAEKTPRGPGSPTATEEKGEKQSIHPQTGFWIHEQIQSLFSKSGVVQRILLLFFFFFFFLSFWGRPACGKGID